MNGWIILALLFAAAIGSLRLLRVRGAFLMFAASAMLFGGAGYALQGHPTLSGSPRAAAMREPPIPLTDLRHEFFGNFTGEADFLYRREVVAGCPKIYGQLVQMLTRYSGVAAARDATPAGS